MSKLLAASITAIVIIVSITTAVSLCIISSNNRPPLDSFNISDTTSTPNPTRIHSSGLQIGDYFKYSLKGYIDLTSPIATASPGFEIYNSTDYYMVTITGLNGNSISMQCNWKLLNETKITTTQTIDLSTGDMTDISGFWAIYQANLNKGDLIRQYRSDSPTVNNTDTITYTSGIRDRCYWFVNNQFYDDNDPTQSTLMYDYRNVFFDRQTGMMTSLTNYQVCNNPQKTQETEWKLVETNAWVI